MKKTGRLSLLIAVAALSACATTSSEYLMNGIDPANVSVLRSTASTNLVDTSSASTSLKSASSVASLDAENPSADLVQGSADLVQSGQVNAKQIKADTCEQFYKNAQVYLKASQQSVQNQVALAQMGVMILATVATGGVGGLGISSATGQMLAQQLATNGVQLGGALAINGINKKSGPAAKVMKTAEELGCRVEFRQPSAQKTP